MTGTKSQKQHPERDNVAELFRHASVRERPAAEDEQAIRKALHAEWSGMTRRRHIRKALFGLAAAASVILAVMVAVSMGRTPEPADPSIRVATIEKQLGTIRVLPGGSRDARIGEDLLALTIGQQIVTGRNSGLALSWLNGESIRLDESTELVLTSEAEIDLLAGKIYVDTEATDPGRELRIATPAGLVRHVGTRYMTTVSAGVTSVSVREGRVLLEKQGVETLADSGDQLRIDASGTLVVQAVPSYGALWQWTEELAPIFPSDGRSMTDFLDWVAHESGREIEFASPAARRLADETRLRGEVDMDPMHALPVVLQTSDLVSEINAGTIVVRLRRGG